MKNLRVLTENYLIKIEKILSGILNPTNDIISDLDKFINTKSKRIRSILCLLYLQAEKQTVNDSVITLLSAAELIHNASLLHDDVIDNAELRRGDITLLKKYNEKVSVLCGDYLLSLAVKQLMMLNNHKILELFLDATVKMSDAEIKQYLQRNKTIMLDEYIEIVYGKTASLFGAVLEGAAILTCADRIKAKLFGESFGVLYQINNDMQDESKENDNENGVKTAVNILGIEKTLILKDNYKKKIREILTTFSDNEYKKGLEDLVNTL